MKRLGLCLVLAAALTVCTGMAPLAAETKIENVKLEFSYGSGGEPENGHEIGGINVTAPGDSPYIVEYAEYINDADVWVVGDRPIVRVELSAKDGYRFSYTSKSRFSLSGCGATYKRADAYDDGMQLELDVYLQRIGGTLDGVSNPSWDGYYAVWDTMEGVKHYEVRLYRNENLIATVETSSDTYDFSGYMNEEGNYTFRVRAVASYNDRAGEWSNYSEDYYVDEEEASYNGSNGMWLQDGTGWWYSYQNGGYPRACWKNLNGAWYYFNPSGYRVTGWNRIDREWYYLSPDGVMLTGWQLVNGSWYYMDGSGVMLTDWQTINGARYYLNESGAMLTGWQYIDGCWYYFNENGAMMTGWQLINGKWYYMDSNGIMYANRWTPDGYYVDQSGAMVQ